MDVCVLPNASDPQNIINLSESSTDPPDLAHQSARDLSMSDLQNCLTEFLNSEDVAISSCVFTPSPEKTVTGVVRIDEYKDPDVGESSNAASLSKSATFPSPGERISSTVERLDGKGKQVDINAEVSLSHGHAKIVSPSYSRSISLPAPLKLVSAMKGSREKQGIPPKKLSVTWDPEVYDPVPTAASHVLSNKNHRHHSDGKRNGKNKQKGGGKSSRGSKGKYKKQGRKISGSSYKLSSLDDNDKLVGFDEPQVSIVDFDVGSRDSFCGSSFLTKSVTKLHYPVAEAT